MFSLASLDTSTWGGEKNCHLSSHYKSYKNVLSLPCSSFHKPETGCNYKVKAYPARDEKLMVFETCFPNPTRKAAWMWWTLWTGTVLRDAGWRAEQEMGWDGEVSLIYREVWEKGVVKRSKGGQQEKSALEEEEGAVKRGRSTLFHFSGQGSAGQIHPCGGSLAQHGLQLVMSSLRLPEL